MRTKKNQVLKIGTRESELAVWQATQVQTFLKEQDVSSELIFINSDGDTDVITPLYEMGVQGIFTKALDTALLNNHIDIAVHSMKDVPTQLPIGIFQASVLKRGSYKDLLVFKDRSVIESWQLSIDNPGPPSGYGGRGGGTIATSSIRRKAQWLHRYPTHTIENLRGNINTRLNKLKESNWDGAIFAAAGLERINLRPENSIELDWMLPAPAQGAIVVLCREDDKKCIKRCQAFDHIPTILCTKIERDFLHTLMGGCSTPISALAQIKNGKVFFKGSICSIDGKRIVNIDREVSIEESIDMGNREADELLMQPSALKIIEEIRNAK